MNDRFIEDLKNRIDLVELVKKYTELKKSGKNYMCRSPFRNERTPSFCVSPEKQFWYDFGNSEGGDAISFIEKVENVSFQESVEHLADIAGLEVPKSSGKKGPSREAKKDIFVLHEKACEFFEKALEKNDQAKKYLENRKITHAIQKEWRLGYGGDKSDGLTKFLLKAGFSQAQIAQSGVAFEREFGLKTMRDRFFGRLMIPVFEPKNGKIIAFTGRDLSGAKKVAKYINSPENPVYHKSSTLFGFYRARKIIGEKESVILVEGNFDVISAHSSGFVNTVATCGTSLTEDHLRMLKRITKNIYLAFDSDLAGKKATLRSVEMCLKMELNPFVIEITGGKDLDELAQNNVAELKKTIEGAQNALLFLLEKFALKNLNKTIEGEKKFLDSIFYFLKLVTRPIEVDDILSKISEKLGRAKSIIEDEFRKFSSQKTKYQKQKYDETSPQKFSRTESFVGFLTSNWKFFGQHLNEKILDLLPEYPKNLLEKKLTNQELTEEEKKTLLGWELHQELLYGENITEERLKKDFKVFVEYLKAEEQKKKRMEEAKSLKESM